MEKIPTKVLSKNIYEFVRSKTNSHLSFSAKIDLITEDIEKFLEKNREKEFSEQEIKDLKLVRNYFGTHDKTTFEHFAYSFLDGIIKKIQK